MTLAEQYDAMREQALRAITQGEANLDALLDSAQDTRRGITLLARPPAAINAAIGAILADFQAVEPGQYYYPATDIHLTILSIISCYDGFTLDKIDPVAYQDAVREVAATSPPFRINFTGLTASPGGIMVQGFPEGDGLQRLRDATRSFFQQSGLQQSIDQRYSIQTAHSTVIRFQRKLHNPDALIALINNYQRLAFGSFEVNTVELVYNDWYQRAANTILLEKYRLSPAH